jgi:anti-sigma factor RsiW
MHAKYSDLLQQYIDGALEPLEKIILAEHLSDCHKCRRELNQLKLLDWDMRHEPVIEPPAELAACRMAALSTHLAAETAAEVTTAAKERWALQKQTVQYTFAFISINPVNRSVNRAVKKTFSALGRAAGAGLKKRNPLLARFMPGQA